MLFFKKKNIESKLLNAKPFVVPFNQGLNDEQIKQRKKEGLVNKKLKSNVKSYYQIILKNLFSGLNIIFLIVAVILLKFQLYKRLYFLFAFLSNFFVNLFADLKARRTIGKISLISNQQISVIRNGVEKKVFFNELVFSDIILLKNKDIVPCDSEVINGNVFVNESFLTGEADDINKTVGSKLLARSVVVNGTCYARVIGIAQSSYILKVQEKLRSFSRPKSQIISFLNKIIFVDTFLAVLIVLIRFALFWAKNGFNFTVEFVDSLTSSFLIMLSIGMYLMISLVLTVTVINLYLKNNVLVNEPFSIETLSESNAFCFDKTGTLTTGEMEVQEVIPIGNNNIEKIKEIIYQIICINKDENLTSQALKKFFLTNQKTFHFDKNQYLSVPFNSKNKYSAISFNNHTYLLGAYDFINANNQDAKDLITKYEQQGFRVLTVAENNQNIVDHKIVGNFDVVGVIVLAEKIRDNFTNKIYEFKKKHNVDMFIISGDSEHFLSAIAKKINFDGKTISLKNVNVSIKDAVKEYKIFARVTPEQKKEIVNELQEQGKIVTMMGDGINDLLALKSANCSIAMPNNDNNVVKSVSHITLFNSDFSNFEKIIETSIKMVNKIKLVCATFLIKAIFAIFLNFIFLMLNADFPYRVNNFFVWESISVAAAPFFITFLEKKNKKIIGNFAENIIIEIVPAVLVQLLSCLLVFIFYRNEFVSLSTIMMSFMSLMFLVHICFPINKIRFVILVFAFISTFVIFLIDYFFCCMKFNFNFFAIDYGTLNKSNLLFLSILFVALSVLYFAIAKIWKTIVKKWFNKKKLFARDKNII